MPTEREQQIIKAAQAQIKICKNKTRLKSTDEASKKVYREW